MKVYLPAPFLLALLASILMLTSCGGGGSSSASNNNPPADDDPIEVIESGITAFIEIESSESGRSDIAVVLADPDAISSGSVFPGVAPIDTISRDARIELASDERLEISVGGEIAVLNAATDDLQNFLKYSGSVNTSTSIDAFRVSLVRADGTIIDNSTANLPEEFMLTAPASGQTFSINDTVAIRWTPARSGERVNISTLNRCSFTDPFLIAVERFFLSLIDDGAEDLQLDQMFPPTGARTSIENVDTSEDCELSIAVERVQIGELDERFDEIGGISAKQVRIVEDLTLTFR